MKKFLLIQSRPEDDASDAEYRSFLRIGGLSEGEVHRIRAEQPGMLQGINLGDYAGIIVGGGPFSMSDDEEKKTDAQKEFETDIQTLLDQVVRDDIPFLGVCYGVGLLTQHQGGVVSKKFGEPISVTDIMLTSAGKQDKLLQGMPEKFRAIVAHKEACEVLPDSAVLLASSHDCPVQMMRFGENVYITQFHPELEVDTLAERIWIYKDHGYFKPEEAQDIIDSVAYEDVSSSWQIIKEFVQYYQR